MEGLDPFEERGIAAEGIRRGRVDEARGPLSGGDRFAVGMESTSTARRDAEEGARCRSRLKEFVC